MQEIDDIKFMRRCLDLAVNAEGLTYPNPIVGSVIVNNGKIIGEGYHLKAGDHHAEVNAINSVRDKGLLKDSTLYVSLEPCSHTGKTPPCADLIVAYKIPRIVIGTSDTSKKVSGKGIRRLKEAGCNVTTGVLEEECRYLNRRFFTFHEKGRPYITLKWAQSADGFIDKLRSEGHNPGPNWISGKPERSLVHKWRSTEQAILIGAGTLRVDHPRLNVRLWKGKDPLRLILSFSGQIGNEVSAKETNGIDIVFTENVDAVNGDMLKVKLDRNRTSSAQVIEYLYSTGIQSLLIEGGASVLNHFISAGLWDEARIFYGKTDFISGIKAPDIEGKIFSTSNFRVCSLEMISNEGSKWVKD
jgi:diaminohydroxyphosphoribosylaminopyrimidine deaminase/5-amino-6-(5-phosphoribosylamino)uracil reductase